MDTPDLRFIHQYCEWLRWSGLGSSKDPFLKRALLLIDQNLTKFQDLAPETYLVKLLQICSEINPQTLETKKLISLVESESLDMTTWSAQRSLEHYIETNLTKSSE